KHDEEDLAGLQGPRPARYSGLRRQYRPTLSNLASDVYCCIALLLFIGSDRRHFTTADEFRGAARPLFRAFEGNAGIVPGAQRLAPALCPLPCEGVETEDLTLYRDSAWLCPGGLCTSVPPAHSATELNLIPIARRTSRHRNHVTAHPAHFHGRIGLLKK